MSTIPSSGLERLGITVEEAADVVRSANVVSTVFLVSQTNPAWSWNVYEDALLWQGSTLGPGTVQMMRRALEAADLAARRRIADEFAQRVGSRSDVREVRLTRVTPDLLVSVVTEGSDLDRELELHAIFIELTQSLPAGSTGDLEIFPATRAPKRLQEAQRIP